MRTMDEISDWIEGELSRIRELAKLAPSCSLLEIAGYLVLLDAEDVERVRREKWRVQVGPHSVSFILSARRPSGVRAKIRLARFIMREDGDRLVLKRPETLSFDYRKASLLVCDNSTKLASQPKKKKGTSKYKGVSRDRNRRWRASIRPHGRSIYLGCFETETEAARAYNEAALFYFGEAAYLNDVES